MQNLNLWLRAQFRREVELVSPYSRVRLLVVLYWNVQKCILRQIKKRFQFVTGMCRNALSGTINNNENVC